MTRTKPNKSGLFSGAAIYLVTSLMNAAIPFMLLPILTRYLEPEEYGQIAMFQVLVNALAAVVGLNTVGAANRRFFDHDGNEGTPTFLGGCLLILFWSLLATLILSFLFSPLLSEFLGLPHIWIMLAPLMAAGMYIVKLRLGQWRVRQQPIKFGALQIAMSLLNATFSIALVVYFAYGAPGRMTGELLAPLCFSVISLWLLYRDGLLRFTYDKNQIKDALRFGTPLIPHVLGGFLLFSVDRLIINQQLGLAQAGIYMVGVQISMGVSICIDAFNKSYSPWLMGELKKNDRQSDKKIVRFTYLYFAGAIVAAGLGFLIGPWLIDLVAGNKYTGAGEVVGFLLAGQCVKGMYYMVVNYILYSKKTSYLSLLTILSGSLNIGLMLLLIPVFGLEGAGYAFLTSSLLLFLGGWIISARVHPMPWLSP
jgi:O-antigen/teichoic acid export membrane protein